MRTDDTIYVKVVVSYGKSTKPDDVGCDGMFIKSTEICTKEIAQLEALKAEIPEWRRVYGHLKAEHAALKRENKGYKEFVGIVRHNDYWPEWCKLEALLTEEQE